jgi:hypothetical protein
MLMVHVRTKIYMLGSSDSLAIAIKPKTKDNFGTAASECRKS